MSWYLLSMFGDTVQKPGALTSKELRQLLNLMATTRGKLGRSILDLRQKSYDTDLSRIKG
jgi:hypothetical protein